MWARRSRTSTTTPGAGKDAWVVGRPLREISHGATLVGRRTILRAAHRGSRTASLLVDAGLDVPSTPQPHISSEETPWCPWRAVDCR